MSATLRAGSGRRGQLARRNRWLGEAGAIAFGVLLAIWTLMPLYNMVLVAVQQKEDVFSTNIWPPAPTGPSDIGRGPNDDSIVLVAEFGSVRILLLADAGVTPQAEIERAASALGVSVVQVAHHGSAYQAPGFATWLHAPLALISVGTGNPYGHPAAATVAAYQGAGASVLRTDKSGDLVVCLDQAGRVSYATRR